MNDELTYAEYCRARGRDPFSLMVADATFADLMVKLGQERDQCAQWERAVLQQGEVIAQLKEQVGGYKRTVWVLLDSMRKEHTAVVRENARLAQALTMIANGVDEGGFCSDGNFPDRVAREALGVVGK